MSARRAPAGRVFWITGASSGIGAALARTAAAAGARVILSSRRAEALAAVAATCDGAPEPPLVLPLDVAEPDAFPAAVEAAWGRWGRVDVLIHNAGVGQRATARETTPEVERRVLEVDYFGPVLLTKAALNRLAAQGGGDLVVISSVMGYLGTPRRAAYAAAKHALHGWFESLREEVRPDGIRVLLACPGYVRTEISRHALSGDGSPHGAMDPGQERGLPAEQAAAAILRAWARGREEMFVGGPEIWAVRLKRWCPRLFARLLRWSVARGRRF